jgi:hypothetical protein
MRKQEGIYYVLGKPTSKRWLCVLDLYGSVLEVFLLPNQNDLSGDRSHVGDLRIKASLNVSFSPYK